MAEAEGFEPSRALTPCPALAGCTTPLRDELFKRVAAFIVFYDFFSSHCLNSGAVFFRVYKPPWATIFGVTIGVGIVAQKSLF